MPTWSEISEQQKQEWSACCSQYGENQGGYAVLSTTEPFLQGQVACFYFEPTNPSNYTGNADSFLDPTTICDAVPKELETKAVNENLIYVLIALVFIGGLWALKKYKVI